MNDSAVLMNALCDAHENYNEVFKSRTKKLAISILRLYRDHCKTEETRIIGKQLMRSATSVAANYRAAIRSRSDAEKYAKLCIVVEESDETVFWLELLNEGALIHESVLKPLHDEAIEIMMVMSAYRKSIKESMGSN